ncbi:hypothetical protein [Paenibacillus sp. NPDC058177]|uniref:hypothetical protein n=1 Tax=Paenibacillus sp. NPDC058177 TaxID=3346369 RepID=UPI0036DBF273
MNAYNLLLLRLLVTGPEETYSHYVKQDEHDQFIQILIDLYHNGLVNMGYKSLVPHGDYVNPIDVVATGIRLTDFGLNEAEHQKKLFLAQYKAGGGDM